jgi:hypothetical protein
MVKWLVERYWASVAASCKSPIAQELDGFDNRLTALETGLTELENQITLCNGTGRG